MPGWREQYKRKSEAAGRRIAPDGALKADWTASVAGRTRCVNLWHDGVVTSISPGLRP